MYKQFLQCKKMSLVTRAFFLGQCFLILAHYLNPYFIKLYPNILGLFVFYDVTLFMLCAVPIYYRLVVLERHLGSLALIVTPFNPC